MAHFARLDENNIVQEVIVVHNDVINNESFPLSESIGVEFCQALYGTDTIWKQTSYNSSFRYNYAGVGYTFDKTAGTHGAFIPPKPYDSWVLNTEKYVWEAPIPCPDDGKPYVWDENARGWVLVTP